MKPSVFFTLLLLLCSLPARPQQSYNITFTHADKTVYGTFSVPAGNGPFPTIILNPGSGANDRDGTLQLIGGNVACLYPGLLNETLKTYKELGEALVDSGYAVLRYDKLEYTYPTTLGVITFHKLWLPVESAIDYVKTRADVDTANIILMGHSEGSALIPFIAKSRNDIKALISLAGARTPFDSLLAYQLVYIAQTCGGNVPQTQLQANQILAYFNLIRKNQWNAGTPALFGVPASAWYDYVQATDPVADNYNSCNLPTLFIGLGLDINVPPAELIRFQNEVNITQDFWSLPGLIHYMTPANDPHISEALTDTIIYWLRKNVLTTGARPDILNEPFFKVSPNPFISDFNIILEKERVKNLEIILQDVSGKTIHREHYEQVSGKIRINLPGDCSPGIYWLQVNADGESAVQKMIKRG